MRSLKIGVVMDPVEKIDIDKDTTFVLMLEAQHRGHEVYFMEVDDLFVRGGTPHGRYRRLELKRATPHYKLGDPVEKRAVLAVFESPELARARADYQAAVTRLRVARATHERENRRSEQQ